MTPHGPVQTNLLGTPMAMTLPIPSLRPDHFELVHLGHPDLYIYWQAGDWPSTERPTYLDL